MKGGLEQLKSIKSFPSLVRYLRDELDWPIESDDAEDLTFEYEPEELGLDKQTAVKIREIKQLRPLAPGQPWGIFYINFEPKRLPIVALRRILRSLVVRKRAAASRPQQRAWQQHDLLFISSYGEADGREMTLAHFSENSGTGDLPTLKVLGWGAGNTVLRLEDTHQVLGEKLRWPEDEADAEGWRESWSSAFKLRYRETVRTSKDLAVKLARLAEDIRGRVNEVLSVESERGELRRLYKAFQEALIHDLSEDDFADMYAQTIAYGLLSASISRQSGALVADNLSDMVPNTNPFLKELMQTFLTVGGRKSRIDFDELGINEVVELLRHTQMDEVLKDFGARNPQEDPVIHFYELFLKEYDPEKRMKRGVFYTPRPVVSFIVRSVDEILRAEFGLEDGLADTTTWGEFVRLQKLRNPQSAIRVPEGVRADEPFVQILDPATGTGTFLVEVIDRIYAAMRAKWRREGKGEREMRELWNDYVPRHLLPRLHGFELMMAPYAIAHMKIGLKLTETKYSFLSSERARVYLTNTLEEPKDFSSYFEQMAPALAHEAQAANKIKRATPVTVVIGNPPYSSLSQNLTPSARRLVQRYKYIGGDKIVERGALQLEKNLQDDYIKFFARAQDFLAVPRLGVISLITNHGFLDNPTLRGFRWSLMDTFRKIWVLDLHGNVNRGEVAPGGSVDQNVFDIKDAGVSIVLGLTDSSQTGMPGSVYHRDLWGDRKESKYPFLVTENIHTVSWGSLSPSPDLYIFTPQDTNTEEEYKYGVKVTELFPLHSIGIITARDRYVIDFEQAPIVERAGKFQKSTLSDEETCKRLGIPIKKGWNIAKARQKIRAESNLQQYVNPLLYRPFDIRPVFYHESLIWGMARPVMQHMLKREQPNLALITSRMTKGESFRHALVSRTLSEVILLSSKTSNNAFVLPLYKYVNTGSSQRALNADVKRQANFSPPIISDLAARLRMTFLRDGVGDCVRTFGPEDVFHYLYAVLNAPTYRGRYGEFLKRDFPRIPLTSDAGLFRELCALGADLVALHLLEDDYEAASWNTSRPKGTSPLQTPITRFAGRGGAEVATGHPKYKDGNVYINPSRYFEGVPPEVWGFHVGGYQVCGKWLKDRRGRTLSDEDVAHYQRVVVALSETVRLMAEIDRAIEEHGGWPLAGSQEAGRPAPGGLSFA